METKCKVRFDAFTIYFRTYLKPARLNLKLSGSTYVLNKKGRKVAIHVVEYSGSFFVLVTMKNTLKF